METSKYKNKKTSIDGIVFDSEAEARYYQRLLVLKANGDIKEFQMQPKFQLQPSFITWSNETIRAITYTADFAILHNDGSKEVVDVKGQETQQGIMRIKMFKYKFPEINLRVMAELPKKYGGGKGIFIELSELKKLRKEAGKNGEKTKTNGKAKTRATKGRKCQGFSRWV